MDRRLVRVRLSDGRVIEGWIPHGSGGGAELAFLEVLRVWDAGGREREPDDEESRLSTDDVVEMEDLTPEASTHWIASTDERLPEALRGADAITVVVPAGRPRREVRRVAEEIAAGNDGARRIVVYVGRRS